MQKADVCISPERLDALRARIPAMMGAKRAAHTLAVEEMAARLGRVLWPGEENERILRAAGLLHDITKEYSFGRQMETGRQLGLRFAPQEIAAPKTLHAMTAAALIPVKYPEFADERVIDAVRYHTTGRAQMMIWEKIIYFADYIDDTRQFPECVRLREAFWGAEPEKMAPAELAAHFRRVLIDSFDVTIAGLLEDRRTIHPDTTAARNDLLMNMDPEEEEYPRTGGKDNK